MSSSPKKRKRLNWDDIKHEFLGFDGSVAEFAKKHGLNESTTLGRSNREKWIKSREDFRAQKREIARKAMLAAEEEKWKNYARAQDGIMAQIFKIIQSTMQDGKVVRPMSPADVQRIATALHTLTKNKSFMDGGPTERSEVKSLHLSLVEELNRREAE